MFALLFALALGVCCNLLQPPQKPVAPPPPPLQYLSSWGAKGDGPDQLQFPVSITTDAKGSVFILDNPPSAAFVHKYDAEGHPLLTFEVPGSKHPRGIAVDIGGAIYAGDAGGFVRIFLPDGKPYRTLHSAGGRSLGLVTGVAVDTLGNVFVADAFGCRIVKFNPRLRFERSWGRRGSAPGEFNYPSNLAIGPDANVDVVELQNQRVQQFSADGIAQGTWSFPVATPPASLASDLEGKDRMEFYGLALSAKYAVVLDAPHGILYFWTPGGELKESVSLAGREEFHASVALTDLAWTPRGELLVLNGTEAKVFQYHVNF